jgi:ketosteroid isomerase-like protein
MAAWAGTAIVGILGGLMVTDEHAAVRRLLDKDEIIDLVHRYSYCVDHNLYDEVAELFTEDCVVDYGPAFAPPVRGRAALRKMFGHPSSRFAATSHHNANVLVIFEDDDRASARTSLYAWHKMADGTTPQLWGYYHDVVVRSSGGWQIATRQLRVLGVADWDIEWHWAVRPPDP